MSYLKFRFWCPAGKAFIKKYHYQGPVDELFSPRKFDVLIPQQCLGIRDRKRRWIYEGDILEFAASQLPAPLALLAGKNLPERLSVEVCRDPSLPSNFHLEVLLPGQKLPTIYLPLELAKKALIAGHIFEKK
jgi:hypothetical protein